MKRTVETWKLEDLDKQRAEISFPEFQREKQLWSDDKKRLLIDSIVQDIDIPKLYFYLNEKDEYEVIDGQQRLWAIWDYFGDEYAYEFREKQLRFSQLSASTDDDVKALSKRIKDYELQVTVIKNATEDYLRDMFLRLQFGLLLNTGEKLHALTGKMKEFIFSDLARDQFLTNLAIPKRRYAQETLSAQISINSFSRAKIGAFARTRYDDLKDFFNEYESPTGKNLSFFRTQTERIRTVLNGLWTCFEGRTKNLRSRAYIVSIYLLYEELADSKGLLPIKERTTFAEFIQKLWERLRQEISAGFDRKNQELYIFETYLSSASGERYQIERRHEKLKQYYAHYKSKNKIMGD